MSPTSDLRDLAAWAEYCACWIEAHARGPNDPGHAAQRTVTFEAAALDEFLTGFRQLPDLIHAITERLEARPTLTLISGGRS